MTLALAGAAVIALVLIDVTWTTVAAGSGAGPFTRRSSRMLWRAALAIHRRTRGHTFLSAAGTLIVAAALITWITLLLAGWTLIFSSTDGAVRAASTGVPADSIDRVLYVGYTVLTLGLGNFVPGKGIWQLATVLATGTGLVLVTLSITYLVPVASAVVQRRQLAAQIAGLGGTAHDIVLRGWNGSDFGTLGMSLSMLQSTLHTVRLQHLAYPVLHFFHSQTRHDATAIHIANLVQAVGLLQYGVRDSVSPDSQTLAAVEDGLDQFLSTIDGVHISDDAAPIAAAALEPLEQAGIPVEASTYRSHVADTERRRRLLTSYLHDDGWTEDDLAVTRGSAAAR
ncbi:MAG: ion channel [Acidimicrobiia bacterium]|jgi:hypothetical protein